MTRQRFWAFGQSLEIWLRFEVTSARIAVEDAATVRLV